MRNEIKVGLLAIGALAMAFWGFQFIKGRNVLSGSNVYKVYFQDVGGLKVGTPVTINGVEVGSVAIVDLLSNSSDNRASGKAEMVEVMFTLDGDQKIPKDAVAVLASAGVMGGMNFQVRYDQPCLGDACAPSGSIIAGKKLDMIASMLGIDPKDAMGDISTAVEKTIKEQLGPDADTQTAETLRDLGATMENLRATTAQLQALMGRSSGEIESSLNNLNTITGTLASKNQEISSIIDNAKNLTDDLSKADIQKTVAEVNTAIAELKGTLNSAEQTLNGLTGTLDKVNNGEGTLGKLLQDDKLYDQLNMMSQNIDSLATDLQERPYRYIPLKSRRKVKRFDRKDAAGQ